MSKYKHEASYIKLFIFSIVSALVVHFYYTFKGSNLLDIQQWVNRKWFVKIITADKKKISSTRDNLFRNAVCIVQNYSLYNVFLTDRNIFTHGDKYTNSHTDIDAHEHTNTITQESLTHTHTRTNT